MDVWEVKYFLLSDLNLLRNSIYPKIYPDIETLVNNIHYAAETVCPRYSDVTVYLNEDPSEKIINYLNRKYPDDIIVIEGAKIQRIIDELDRDGLVKGESLWISGE